MIPISTVTCFGNEWEWEYILVFTDVKFYSSNAIEFVILRRETLTKQDSLRDREREEEREESLLRSVEKKCSCRFWVERVADYYEGFP